MKRGTMTAHAWVVAVMLVLASFASVPAASADSVVTVDKVVVETGDTLVLQLKGFRNNEAVVTWASSSRGTVYTTASGSVDNDGNGTIRIGIKRYWEPGWWAITVWAPDSKREAVAQFEVRTGPPDGPLQLSSNTIAPGTTLQASGTGFREGELVSVWLTRPDGTTVKAPASPVRSIRTIIAFNYDVPADAPVGVWAATAYGNTSDRMLVSQFTVAR